MPQITKRTPAHTIWESLPADIRTLSREDLRSWLCFKLGYSYFEVGVNKLTDRLIAIRNAQ